MFEASFKTGNAAFDDDYYDNAKIDESIRILKEIIKKLEDGYMSSVCMDINGNKVGTWSLD